MEQMLDVIKNMLVAGVDSEKVMLDTAGRFYETIEDQKREHRLLE